MMSQNLVLWKVRGRDGALARSGCWDFQIAGRVPLDVCAGMGRRLGVLEAAHIDELSGLTRAHIEECKKVVPDKYPDRQTKCFGLSDT